MPLGRSWGHGQPSPGGRPFGCPEQQLRGGSHVGACARTAPGGGQPCQLTFIQTQKDRPREAPARSPVRPSDWGWSPFLGAQEKPNGLKMRELKPWGGGRGHSPHMPRSHKGRQTRPQAGRNGETEAKAWWNCAGEGRGGQGQPWPGCRTRRPGPSTHSLHSLGQTCQLQDSASSSPPPRSLPGATS